MYLVDTCAFIWTVRKEAKLSSAVLNILSGYDDVYISHASLWEIAIKQTTGKLDLKYDSFELEDLCRLEGIEILTLKAGYFERIKKLPLIHRDPFDRIIMATAIEEDLTIITNDSNITRYKDVKTLW